MIKLTAVFTVVFVASVSFIGCSSDNYFSRMHREQDFIASCRARNGVITHERTDLSLLPSSPVHLNPFLKCTYPISNATHESERWPASRKDEMANAWEKAQETNSFVGYTDFIHKYPNSKYSDEAINRIMKFINKKGSSPK